jgi:hypothetical protein
VVVFAQQQVFAWFLLVDDQPKAIRKKRSGSAKLPDTHKDVHGCTNQPADNVNR